LRRQACGHLGQKHNFDFRLFRRFLGKETNASIQFHLFAAFCSRFLSVKRPGCSMVPF